MSLVLIDGVRYAPLGDTPSIGIGITTHNRPEALEQCLKAHEKFLPTGGRVVVVDDASQPAVKDADYRFEKNVGVALAKNKCLELLQGAEHVFLFDDDTYPTVEDWWRAYVESPEPHLMYTFRSDAKQLYKDSSIIAWSDPCGSMLYFHRTALETVGGMSPLFGVWGDEHVDLSNRIHNAGLTSFRYGDVPDSKKLITSLDETGSIARSVPEKTRDDQVKRNAPILASRADSTEFVPYVTQTDLTVTCYLTGSIDPQRNKRLAADPKAIDGLRTSIKAGEFVVLHDNLDKNDSPYVRVEACLQPYYQRWFTTWQYLRNREDVRYVFAVDATDVQMLRNPFDEMEPGKLYLGDEATVLGCDWMVKNHKAANIAEFIRNNADAQLLNSGIVGGDRRTVMRFMHAMCRVMMDNHIARVHGRESETVGLGEMGVLNYVAYTEFADQIIHGPKVNTVFKAEEKDNRTAWWKHK